MKISFANILAVGILAFGSLSANSAIITDLSERDWLTSGDGLLSYDASSGLEWLDLTVTAGNSILATEAESFFLSGDFTWASSAQIQDLVDAAVVGDGYRDSTVSTDVANTRDFLSLLGATGSGPGDYAIMSGVSRGSPVGGGYGPSVVVAYDSNSPMVTVFDPGSAGWISETRASVGVGSWLVRAAEPTDVPEPATLSLLGLGLAGLGFSRRQKKS